MNTRRKPYHAYRLGSGEGTGGSMTPGQIFGTYMDAVREHGYDSDQALDAFGKWAEAAGQTQKLNPCGYCRRCAIHDDPCGCLEVEAFRAENTAVPFGDARHPSEIYPVAPIERLAAGPGEGLCLGCGKPGLDDCGECRSEYWTPQCTTCGGEVESDLARLGSVRCRDCRDGIGQISDFLRRAA